MPPNHRSYWSSVVAMSAYEASMEANNDLPNRGGRTKVTLSASSSSSKYPVLSTKNWPFSRIFVKLVRPYGNKDAGVGLEDFDEDFRRISLENERSVHRGVEQSKLLRLSVNDDASVEKPSFIFYL